MKKFKITLICICVLSNFIFSNDVLAGDSIQIPVKGKVTLVDITSKDCEPCENMIPIIDKVKKDYFGKIEVVLVDFWKNPKIVKKIGTNTSPTILIFNKSGEEVFRGYGFVTEKELIFQLKRIL